MSVERTVIKEAEHLIERPLEEIAERELEKRGGVAALRSAMKDLLGLSKNAIQTLQEKLPAVLEAIIDGPLVRRIETAEARTAAALFGATDQRAADILLSEEVYRGQLRRLTAFVTGGEFEQLIKSPREFQKFEKVAAALFERQARRIDRYAALRVESDAYNQIVKRLYPKDYGSLLIDDHHIIEERTFEKFKKTWQLLGWTSEKEMPSIALMYEFHRRTPRTLLPDVKVWKFPDEDVKSLTGLLKGKINLDKIATTDKLLDAYEDFYRGTGIWSDVEPALKDVRREIARRETAAKLVKAAKGL